jgi:hypothetical protein
VVRHAWPAKRHGPRGARPDAGTAPGGNLTGGQPWAHWPAQVTCRRRSGANTCSALSRAFTRTTPAPGGERVMILTFAVRC